MIPALGDQTLEPLPKNFFCCKIGPLKLQQDFDVYFEAFDEFVAMTFFMKGAFSNRNSKYFHFLWDRR